MPLSQDQLNLLSKYWEDQTPAASDLNFKLEDLSKMLCSPGRLSFCFFRLGASTTPVQSELRAEDNFLSEKLNAYLEQLKANGFCFKDIYKPIRDLMNKDTPLGIMQGYFSSAKETDQYFALELIVNLAKTQKKLFAFLLGFYLACDRSLEAKLFGTHTILACLIEEQDFELVDLLVELGADPKNVGRPQIKLYNEHIEEMKTDEKYGLSLGG